MLFIFRALSRLLGVFYLIAHPLVPRRLKVPLLLLPLYLIWPRDLVFDFSSGIGHIDDLLIILIGLSLFKSRAGKHIRTPSDSGEDHDARTISTSFRDVDGPTDGEPGSPEGPQGESNDDSV